jgi:hypothetical protein
VCPGAESRGAESGASCPLLSEGFVVSVRRFAAIATLSVRARLATPGACPALPRVRPRTRSSRHSPPPLPPSPHTAASPSAPAAAEPGAATPARGSRDHGITRITGSRDHGITGSRDHGITRITCLLRVHPEFGIVGLQAGHMLDGCASAVQHMCPSCAAAAPQLLPSCPSPAASCWLAQSRSSAKALATTQPRTPATCTRPQRQPPECGFS